MSMFHVEYYPVPRQSNSKGNGGTGKGGKGVGKSKKFYNDQGVSYRTGMGCSKHDNCFTCPFPDCVFLTHNNWYSPNHDLTFMSNVGDGIKVW